MTTVPLMATRRAALRVARLAFLSAWPGERVAAECYARRYWIWFADRIRDLRAENKERRRRKRRASR